MASPDEQKLSLSAIQANTPIGGKMIAGTRSGLSIQTSRSGKMISKTCSGQAIKCHKKSKNKTCQHHVIHHAVRAAIAKNISIA